MESRVVPAMGVTMDCSFCRSALVKDDFPTLGIPTMDRRIPISFSSCSLIPDKFNSSKMWSKRSPDIRPVSAETGWIGSMASSWNPWTCASDSRLSHLFTTMMAFFPDDRTNWARVRSDAVGSSLPSTMNRIRSASATAAWACFRTALLNTSISSGMYPPVSIKVRWWVTHSISP